MNPRDILQNAWKKRGVPACLMLPLAGVFLLLTSLRHLAYRRGWLHSERLPVPVVVVGNIIVGGSGKTPLVLWLAQRLQQSGRRPGIVSRGYGARDDAGTVREVSADSAAQSVGDEPVLLKRRSGLPLFVGSDRVAAARALLLAHPECDLIICDDGLQHYRLMRDVEIVVLDERGLLNGWPLPAGPLRELPARLVSVDAVVLNGEIDTTSANRPAFRMKLTGATFYRLDNPQQTCEVASLSSLRLAAIAGIGAPERFFRHLESIGLKFSRHAFPDHHRYVAADIAGIDADALLMTEKDAVKCAGFDPRPVWVLPVTAQIESRDGGVSLADLVACRIEEKEKALGSTTA